MGESSCHPALILEDILEVMFRKLPVEELKKCRLICRKWEEASRTLMKNQSQLLLTGDMQRNFALGEFLRRDLHFFIPSKLKIHMFYDFIATGLTNSTNENPSGDQPVPNDAEEHIEMKLKGLEDIYGILGKHSVEELEIRSYGPFNSTSTAGRVLSILGHLSTSLKSLKTYFSPEDEIPTWQQNFDICPLITKLHIGRAPEWIHNRIFSVCPNLAEIIGKNCDLEVLEKTAGGLRKISGFSCSTEKDLEILGRKSGNLKELSLVVRGSVWESTMEFLQTKKESLKLLELKFRKVPETLRLGHGFRQLTKLQLALEMGRDEKQCRVDVCFARDTPQLKYFKLVVVVIGDDEQNWKDLLAYMSNIALGDRVIPLRTLTHLDLSVGGRVDRDCANYLRHLFPSLASFKIKRASGDFLRGLWQMENLLAIHIEVAEYNNHWIDYEYEDVGDLGVVLFGPPQQNQEAEESILNLKNLRSLSIIKDYWNVCGSRIPEKTVRNGFGKMRRLAVLKVPKFCMTPEARGFLRANLPFLKELELNDRV